MAISMFATPDIDLHIAQEERIATWEEPMTEVQDIAHCNISKEGDGSTSNTADEVQMDQEMEEEERDDEQDTVMTDPKPTGDTGQTAQ